MDTRARTDLSSFDNRWYRPGRSLPVRALWLAVNAGFFLTAVPWPSPLKRALLRAFGAKVGRGVVLKPRINVKYPWNVEIRDRAWVGEGAWLDSLGRITVGADACVSQGVTIETGNHDWSSPSFDLVIRDVTLEDGAWAGVRSVLLPGSRLASHAVLGGGGVLSGPTEPYSVYVGNPAVKRKERRIEARPSPRAGPPRRRAVGHSREEHHA